MENRRIDINIKQSRRPRIAAGLDSTVDAEEEEEERESSRVRY